MDDPTTRFREKRVDLDDYCVYRGIQPTKRVLLVDIEDQAMAFFDGYELKELFPISTSKAAPSCVENSFGTPLGLHSIVERYGQDADLGTVFRGRASIGKRYFELPEEEQFTNLITSRILRLSGLEFGTNAGPGVDSYDRYIYIHGTNHEHRIGHPFSGGCIEMTNDAVIRLFEEVEVGTLVWIQ